MFKIVSKPLASSFQTMLPRLSRSFRSNGRRRGKLLNVKDHLDMKRHERELFMKKVESTIQSTIQSALESFKSELKDFAGNCPMHEKGEVGSKELGSVIDCVEKNDLIVFRGARILENNEVYKTLGKRDVCERELRMIKEATIGGSYYPMTPLGSYTIRDIYYECQPGCGILVYGGAKKDQMYVPDVKKDAPATYIHPDLLKLLITMPQEKQLEIIDLISIMDVFLELNTWFKKNVVKWIPGWLIIVYDFLQKVPELRALWDTFVFVLGVLFMYLTSLVASITLEGFTSFLQGWAHNILLEGCHPDVRLWLDIRGEA